MPADVVCIEEGGDPGLVEFSIALEPGNPLFEGAAKPGADFKTVIGGATGHHGIFLARRY